MAYSGVFVFGDSLVDAGNALKLAQWYDGLPFTVFDAGDESLQALVVIGFMQMRQQVADGAAFGTRRMPQGGGKGKNHAPMLGGPHGRTE